MKNYKTLSLISVLTILLFIGGVLLYNCWSKKELSQSETESENVEPGEFSAGTIGENLEEESPLPPAIFNTTGIIKEINKDSMVVEGDGSNFADQKPRSLTLIFTDETITFEPGQKVFYRGLNGLKYLEPEMAILIDGAENIRGKISFEVKTINIIQ